MPALSNRLHCLSINTTDITSSAAAEEDTYSKNITTNMQTGFPVKSWNLRKEFSRPGKSWKMTVVMKSHGIPPIGHGIV